MLGVVIATEADRKVHENSLMHITRAHREANPLFLERTPVPQAHGGVYQRALHLLPQCIGLMGGEVRDDVGNHHVIAGHDHVGRRNLMDFVFIHVANCHILSAPSRAAMVNIDRGAPQPDAGRLIAAVQLLVFKPRVNE